MPLIPNQQLFEYQIIRRLGQGAFGTVYLAHDTLAGSLRCRQGTNDHHSNRRGRFQTLHSRGASAGSLNHPHIVTVHALKVVKNEVHWCWNIWPAAVYRAFWTAGPLASGAGSAYRR